MMSDICLKLADLTHRYDSRDSPADERIFFNGFSATLRYGAVIGILGLNGSGKSTLLNLLTLKIKPTYGHIRWNRAFFSKGGGGIIIEQGIAPFLLPWLTGNMHRAMLDRSDLGPYIPECTDELLPFLTSLMHKPVFKLSGGERQTLALYLLFGLKWQVGIFDEPLSAIDGNRARTILVHLFAKHLREHPTKTVFMVSHRIDHLIYLCDEIWVLSSIGDIINVVPNPYHRTSGILLGELPEEFIGHLQTQML